jgi:hypothetical protein
MKIGMQLTDLTAKVTEQAKTKKDYVMETTKLIMSERGKLQFALPDRQVELDVTPLCLEQIGNRVGIPAKYLDRMAHDAPGLLAQNVNHWFQANPEKRMVRTLQNGVQQARAFLSKKYRALDNYDLMGAVLPNLARAGCRIESAQLTETRLYLQCVMPSLFLDIKEANRGDTLFAGVTISNSEVGNGSIRVEPLIWKLACKNGLILPTSLKKHHVGRAGDGGIDGGDAYEVFSDETRQLDDKAFWAKVNDVVGAALDTAKFAQNVKLLQDTTTVDIGKPQDAIEIVAERCKLTDKEGESVLEHLIRGGDLSVWGLTNAVTRTAEDSDSYDRAVELERIGYDVVEMAQTVFSKN